MRVSIYSIHQTLFEGDAEKLICHTPQGQITVLDHHIPLISNLTGPSVEVVRADGAREKIPLSAGMLEVRPESEVVILAN